MSIRPATPADLVALIDLEQQFPGDRLSRRSLRRLLRAPSARVLVAEIESGLAGTLILLTRRNSRRGRIYSLIVAPQHRGRGIAGELVHAAENHCRAAGLSSLRLEVRQDNHAARCFYERLGFAEVAALPGYYDDGSDGLRLERRLAAGDGGLMRHPASRRNRAGSAPSRE